MKVTRTYCDYTLERDHRDHEWSVEGHPEFGVFQSPAQFEAFIERDERFQTATLEGIFMAIASKDGGSWQIYRHVSGGSIFPLKLKERFTGSREQMEQWIKVITKGTWNTTKPLEQEMRR